MSGRQLLSTAVATTIPTAMGTKAQHRQAYQPVPHFIRRLREDAGMTQREIGAILKRPQSWVYDCESGNRRVDVIEFCDWCRACGVEPETAVRKLVRRQG